jgi:DNA-binding CsgD family transcriptional regulator
VDVFDASPTTVGLVTAALLVLLACRIHWQRSVFPSIFWVLLPTAAAVLILLHVLPAGDGVFAATVIGVYFFYSLMTLFAVAFQLTVVSQGEFSPLFSLGVSLCLVAASALLGRALAHSGLGEAQRGELLMVVACAYFVYLLVSPAVQLWRIRRISLEGYQTEHPATKVTPEILENTPETTGEVAARHRGDDLTAMCDVLATEHNLSRREREILDYLSRGYNSPYIAKAFFISESTVRSHIKKIYQKISVNSRMELLELLETCVQKGKES